MVQRDWLVEMLFDVPANPLNGVGLRITARRSRLATQARAEACFLGIFRPKEEGDILTARTFRGAGWTAVDARAGHSKEELAIAAGVSRQHCIPPFVFESC